MDGNGGNRGENLGGDGGEECREKRRGFVVNLLCFLLRKTNPRKIRIKTWGKFSTPNPRQIHAHINAPKNKQNDWHKTANPRDEEKFHAAFGEAAP